MPLPLKTGHNFNYDRKLRPARYEMSTAEAYTEFYGISYMLSGSRLIYSPNFTTIASADDVVFIPKNVYRRTTYISDEPYERIIIKFTDSMVEELIKTVGRDTFDELFNEHVIHFAPETKQKILSVFLEMETEWNNYSDYSELVLKGLLNKLIIICIRERIVSGVNMLNSGKNHTHIINAARFIKIHLRDNPTLEKTAAGINISPSYLSKLFIKDMHTPFSTFVLNEKITYAQNLLANSNLSMTEIAYESGFSSNAYFSDCFRRVVGMSPLKFRKAVSEM
ncbi:MAG: helix-turn-helix transcriptional regulator [Lachnospira sp.]